jgi:hypothetical protein
MSQLQKSIGLGSSSSAQGFAYPLGWISPENPFIAGTMY